MINRIFAPVLLNLLNSLRKRDILRDSIHTPADIDLD